MIKALLISAFVAFSGFTNIQNVKVDLEASTVKWVGAKITGEHTGTIQLKSGNLEMKDGQLVGGSFTLDMTTIVDEDLSGNSKTKLENHLMSDDFFGAEKYPTSKFVITNVVSQGVGTYKVIGDITIRETTEEIQFIATTNEKDGRLIAKADITIDRSKFDVKHRSGSFFDDLGDRLIYDNFDLSVELVATM